MATVVFDAMGTLFDLAPVREAIGGAERLEAWFERILHSGATLGAAGAWAPFDELAAAVLDTTIAKLGLAVDRAAVLASLRELEPYPDAADAIAAAPGAAILSNGAVKATRALLDSAGLEVAHVLSVDEVRRYKPFPEAYRLARERVGPFVLVAAHAWDVAGARAAGAQAVWVDRDERVWPLPGLEPGRRASSLVDAVALAHTA